ncbi:MAG: DUF4234 domain-containing protein [Myxococcota bacterium]
MSYSKELMARQGGPLSGPDPERHIRSIPLDIIFTLLSCGLFNFWVQYKQMQAVNDMMGTEHYRFLPWLLLTLVTCGLYHIYHEYRKSRDVQQALGDGSSSEPIINVILSVMGLHVVADAIQQAEINRYFGNEEL